MRRNRFIAPLAVVVLLATAGCLGGTAGFTDGSPAAGEIEEGSPDGGSSTVSVGATGEATAEPDRAVLTVGVEAKAADPETARQRVADNVSTMRAALADAGVGDDQVTTRHYTIREDRESKRNGATETNYRAVHSFEIEIEDVDRVGTVIETAVNSGATNVGRIQFTLSEDTRSDLREEALATAMTTARADAEILADNANLTLAGVESAATDTGNVRPYQAEANMATSDGGTDVESGPVSVTARVQVTYNATS